jgi:hypothetical protein
LINILVFVKLRESEVVQFNCLCVLNEPASVEISFFCLMLHVWQCLGRLFLLIRVVVEPESKNTFSIFLDPTDEMASIVCVNSTSGGERSLATPAYQGRLALIFLPLGAAVNKIKSATRTLPNA